MTTNEPPASWISDPAAHSGLVNTGSLSFALFGAPVAWSVSALISVSLAGHACYPTIMPLAVPVWSGLWPTLLSISLIATAITTLASLVALRDWRKADREQPSSNQDPLEVSQGRNRFLAAWGLLTSVAFLITMVFSTVMLFLVPVCDG